MLAIDRPNADLMLCGERNDQCTRADNCFLVREGDRFAGLDGSSGRNDCCVTRRRGDNDVDIRMGRGLDQAFSAANKPRGCREITRIQFRRCAGDQVRPRRRRLLDEKLTIRSAGNSDDTKAFRQPLNDVECLGADRPGRAEDRDPDRRIAG